MPRGKNSYRPDKDGTHRAQFDKNKAKIYATQDVCGICGRPVEKENGHWKYKYPHPLSPCIDHIVPIDKGGHPSDINNLQLAHWTCNREKSDKIFRISKEEKAKQDIVDNRRLPQLIDWEEYRSK